MKISILIVLFTVIKSFFMFSQPESIEYYDNGIVKARSQMINGIQQNILYYESGNIQTVSSWKDHKKEGVMIHYYENGNIKYYTNFKNGLINGVEIMNYENGVTRQTQNQINGKIEGPVSHFYEDGTLASFYTHINGKILGHTIFYYPNGKIQQKGYFDEKGTGELIDYDNEGKIISECYYKKGVLIKGSCIE